MAQSQVMTRTATATLEAIPEAKKVLEVRKPPRGHWVGDGFPVRTIFDYGNAAATTPFLLMDYAGPYPFAAASKRRGVGEHPHRGFETVTILYSGEVEHRDSGGGGGKIGPGDVQWMTAGSGVVHEELHSDAYTKSGGRITLRKFEGQPHTFISQNPTSPASVEALGVITDFIRKQTQK